jgi:hypothetical protein
MEPTQSNDSTEPVLDEIGGKVALVDAEIRGAHVGFDIAEIEGPAGSALAGIGVHLTPERLTEYARAVSESTDFDFNL